ncbi:uncharacterized protein LOC129597293 [Paramacrobiotus metropolitanus]|uniref:uncharacterized protein LOC129597293 n=1 Tax=Paramacrobiotus metropolitanus TaxID=2943436 RepID=UPI002445E236|nr:uncharacterized protein LOC129597293 [Paramacrobiotus metropolitanus]
MSRVVLYLVSTLLLAGLAAASSEPHPPEVTQAKKIDDEAKKAVNAVSTEIKAKAKVSRGTILLPETYANQLDFYAGVIRSVYFVKIRLGGGPAGTYIHAKIKREDKGKYNLWGIKNVRKEDPIVYFN